MARLTVAGAVMAIAVGSAAAQTASDLPKSDGQLNAVYNKLQAKISDAGRKSLQTAQQS